MEIFATEELPSLLRRKRVWTLNETDYFLTEFSFREDPDFCEEILKRCTALGFRPVIAHPERYYFVQDDPQLAFEWCLAGYALQINKGSLLGRFGTRFRLLTRKFEVSPPKTYRLRASRCARRLPAAYCATGKAFSPSRRRDFTPWARARDTRAAL